MKEDLLHRAAEEEGEVAFFENDPYIADPNFKFRTDSLHKINWRNINRINLSALRQNPTTSLEEANQVFR